MAYSGIIDIILESVVDMQLNFHKATFLVSAATFSQLPPEQGKEVAFVGRSNVGKSSALNALTQQKSLARTSKTPGRTQLINFFSLDEERRLVDLPGYGYAKVAKAVKQRWQKTLDQYLSQRQCLQGVVLLIDIRHPLKEFDMSMLEWGQHYQIPMHILLTKADKLSRSASMAALQNFKNQLKDFDKISIQTFSASKKTGLEELKSALNQWLT